MDEQPTPRAGSVGERGARLVRSGRASRRVAAREDGVYAEVKLAGETGERDGLVYEYGGEGLYWRICASHLCLTGNYKLGFRQVREVVGEILSRVWIEYLFPTETLEVEDMKDEREV